MQSVFEQFEVVNLIGVVMLTNVSFVGMVGVLIVLGMGRMVLTYGATIGNKWRLVYEMIYTQVVGMVYESIGKGAGRYVKVVFTLCMLIVMSNMLGLIPYSYTVTSQLVLTLTLALGVWIGKLLIGVNKHGLKLMGILIPSGVGVGMVPFFVIVEAIGFIIPVVSLSVRLFANMMSGHVLLKVLFGFTWMMLMNGTLLHVIPLAVLFCLLGLEVAVSVIQAYVFTLLTCIYIGDMESGGH